MQGARAVAAVLVASGLVATTLFVAHAVLGDAPGPSKTPPSVAASAGGEPLDVSGSGLGEHPFGADAEEVRAALTERFGEPDVSVGPQRYVRTAGHEGWFEDPDDPTSMSWGYRVTSVSCWNVLCVIFGGTNADTLRLRGWELAEYRRWSEFDRLQDLRAPDVRLAGTGVRLGDSWSQLHAAYPDTVVRGAEGGSVAVAGLPWTGIFDGAASWRLSGSWDPSRPRRAPGDAVVTRLSGGEGPQPGCC